MQRNNYRATCWPELQAIVTATNGQPTVEQIMPILHREMVAWAGTYRLAPGRDDSDDLAQMVFIRAWRAWPNNNFENADKLLGWCNRVMANLMRSMWRRDQLVRFERIDNGTAWMARFGAWDDSGVNIEEEVETREHWHAARATALTCWYGAWLVELVEELDNYEQLAVREGITRRAVKSRLWRARQAMKHQLAEWR